MGRRGRKRTAEARELLFSPERIRTRADSIQELVAGLPLVEDCSSDPDRLVVALLEEASELLTGMATEVVAGHMVNAHVLFRPFLERIVVVNWLLIDPERNLVRFKGGVKSEEFDLVQRLSGIGILPAHVKDLDKADLPELADARPLPNLRQLAEAAEKRWVEVEDWPDVGDPTGLVAMSVHAYRITSNGYTHPGSATLNRAFRVPEGKDGEETFWVAPAPVLFFRTMRVVISQTELADPSVLDHLDVALDVVV